MSLDYEDFASGGMSIINPSLRLPYSAYKRTAQFKREQMWKPQVDSRNPKGTQHRYWDLRDMDDNLTGNHVHEVRGQRIYRGQCKACGDVVLTVRDVSGPECRGRGNPCKRGRWPTYCTGAACQARRQQARADQSRKGMAQLRRDPSSRKRDYEFRERFELGEAAIQALQEHFRNRD